MAFQHWGNWGGPGWSDGHKTYPGENINWDGPVTDAVDAVFRDHDHAYDNAIKKYEASEKNSADKQQYWKEIIAADKACTDSLGPMIIPQSLPDDLDISQPPSFATLFELKEIEEFNLGRLAGHGVLNATSSAGTYFSFAGIPTQFTSWHLDALRLIAPVLNDLFLNYIAYGKKESAVFLSKLTCRQTEIVRLTARGKNGKSIALELCISEKTVRNQLTSIYAELGVRSRFELMNLLR